MGAEFAQKSDSTGMSTIKINKRTVFNKSVQGIFFMKLDKRTFNRDIRVCPVYIFSDFS